MRLLGRDPSTFEDRLDDMGRLHLHFCAGCGIQPPELMMRVLWNKKLAQLDSVGLGSRRQPLLRPVSV